VEPLGPLPEGFEARLTVPLAGAEPAELRETPPQRAQGQRGRRRVAVRRPRRQGGPLLGGADDRARPRGRGPARPGAMVATPGHHPGKRHGPPPAGPLPSQACPWHIRPWETRQPSPRKRGLARGRAGFEGEFFYKALRMPISLPQFPPLRSPLTSGGRRQAHARRPGVSRQRSYGGPGCWQKALLRQRGLAPQRHPERPPPWAQNTYPPQARRSARPGPLGTQARHSEERAGGHRLVGLPPHPAPPPRGHGAGQPQSRRPGG
jgi:hypothetical protein